MAIVNSYVKLSECNSCNWSLGMAFVPSTDRKKIHLLGRTHAKINIEGTIKGHLKTWLMFNFQTNWIQCNLFHVLSSSPVIVRYTVAINQQCFDAFYQLRAAPAASKSTDLVRGRFPWSRRIGRSSPDPGAWAALKKQEATHGMCNFMEKIHVPSVLEFKIAMEIHMDFLTGKSLSMGHFSCWRYANYQGLEPGRFEPLSWWFESHTRYPCSSGNMILLRTGTGWYKAF